MLPSSLYTPLNVVSGAVLLAGIAIPALQKSARNKKLAGSGINDIDRMQGRVFEEYLAVVFRRNGYHVELTPASKDQGADLVISKNGIRTVVQAKRWKGRVGNSAVQEVVASKPYYRADQAIIVTNSEFTSSAIALAKANHVTLWDRKKLIEELVHTDAKKEVAATGAVPTKPVERNSNDKVCPRCGGNLIVRHRKKDNEPFWGCSNYPRCRYIETK